MRGAFLTLALSLTAHLGAAAALLSHRNNSEISDPPPAAAGETFELPAPDTPVPPLANASPSPETTPPGEPAPAEDGEPAPTPPRPTTSHGRAAARASRATRPSAGRAAPTKNAESDPGSSGSSAQYGAVGERSASDLATAFTRGFPQAASADPAWRSATFGSAGEADVTLTLDAAGRIESSSVTGAPSPALAAGIRRTMALIQGRQFVAHGKVTRLHLTAQVTSDAVHDGLHGDVFAIGGSYVSGEGSAFFALAVGRRIDLRVRAR